jgi:hypothetical protein
MYSVANARSKTPKNNPNNSDIRSIMIEQLITENVQFYRDSA